MGFSGGLVVTKPSANARDVSLIPGSGRSPGEGNGNLLQYSCLRNPMDRGAWWAKVHRVVKSQTRLDAHMHTQPQFVLQVPMKIQAGFRKGRGNRDEIANIRGSSKKQQSSRKTSTSAFIDYAKPFDCVDHSKLWKILKEMGIPDHLTGLLRICMQVKKQQLELDAKQQTGFKLGKE